MSANVHKPYKTGNVGQTNQVQKFTHPFIKNKEEE